MRILLSISLLLIAGCNTANHPQSSKITAVDVLASLDHKLSATSDVIKAIDDAREIVADNLRNADTVGYKAKIVRVDGKSTFIANDLEQGSLENSGRDWDIAISGRGFFRVKTNANHPNGYAYTRNGNYFINNQCELVLGMGDGYKVDPPINVPMNTTEVNISKDGIIKVMVSGQVNSQQIGRLNLYMFTNPWRLTDIGRGLYIETIESGEPIESFPEENGSGSLYQSFLEKSNVQIDREHLRDEYLKRWRAMLMQSATNWP